jgi:hypothetical protein
MIELETGIIKRNNNNVKASHYSRYNGTIILSNKNRTIENIKGKRNILLYFNKNIFR